MPTCLPDEATTGAVISSLQLQLRGHHLAAGASSDHHAPDGIIYSDIYPNTRRRLRRSRTGYSSAVTESRLTEVDMLLAVAAVLLVLWLLGFLAFHLGAFIHILIVIAVVVLVLHFVRGRGARV